MIPILIGAAVAGAAAYKFLGKERHDQALHENISKRYISESEVPPDVLEKINKKQRERNSKEIV